MSETSNPGARTGPTFQSMRATLRAPRTAVVFDGGDHWRSHAARALFQVGRIWGGSGFILVPHHDGVVNPALRRMVVAYDPDYVVALPTTQDDVAAIRPELVGRDGDKVLEGEERAEAVARWGGQRMKDPTGRAARNVLAGDCSRHRVAVPGSEHRPAAARHHEPTTSLGAGGVGPFTSVDQLRGKDDPEPAGVPAQFGGSWALAAAMRVGLRDKPQLPYEAGSVEGGDPEAATQQLAAAALRYRSAEFQYVYREQPGWASAWLASETGLVSTQSWLADRKPHLLVLGDTADDFALALGWDRMFGRSRWIPEVAVPLGPLASTMSALAHDLSSVTEDQGVAALLTSTSVGNEALREAARWFEERERAVSVRWCEDDEDANVGALVAEADEDADPADSGGENGVVDSSPSRIGVTGASELDWSDPGQLAIVGQYDLPLALPAEVDEHGDLVFLVDLPPLLPEAATVTTVDGGRLTWQVDLMIPRPTPRGRGLSPRLLQEERPFPEVVRSSRAGLTCYSMSYGFVSGGSTAVQQLAKPRLRLPGLMSWVRGMAHEEDLSAGFSDAGHRVEILRRTWGDRQSLARDWSGHLRPLFLAYGRKGKSTREAYPNKEGVYLPGLGGLLSFAGMAHLEGVSKGLSDESLRALRAEVDRLAKLGILRRGIILSCESCADVAFVVAESFGHINVCTRCGATNALTAERWQSPSSVFLPEPEFFYDLHPAARELVQQDAGVALLLSHHLGRTASSYADLSEVEFYSEGKPVAEVDLIACLDDRVVVAEAKRTPRLASGAAARNAKAHKLARVAHALRADEVILCTSSNDRWRDSDVQAVENALNSAFEDRPSAPLLRTICGLGTPDIADAFPPSSNS